MNGFPSSKASTFESEIMISTWYFVPSSKVNFFESTVPGLFSLSVLLVTENLAKESFKINFSADLAKSPTVTPPPLVILKSNDSMWLAGILA